MSLEAEFTQALEGTVDAAKAHKYVPTYFIQMLAEYGGVETAKRLLTESQRELEALLPSILDRAFKGELC